MIAIFLLTGAAMAILQLFDSGISYLGRTSQLTTARLVAENNLAWLRGQARDPAFYRNIGSVLGTDRTDPDHSGFTVRFEGTPSGLETFSPSTNMESIYDVANQRIIPGGVVPIRCTVSWQNQSLSVLTYIAEPAATIDPDTAVRVTGAGSIPANGQDTFVAKFYDAGGREIPGVMFSWSIESIDGNGTILKRQSARSGTSVLVENKYAYNFRTDTWGDRPGAARMRATARYNGIEYVGYSGDFQFGG